MVAFDILSEAIRSFMCVSLNGFVLIMIMFQPLRPTSGKRSSAPVETSERTFGYAALSSNQFPAN